MSLDRVKQTVPVVGTGPVALTADASPGGYRPFIAAMNPGDVAIACLVDLVTYQFEVSAVTFEADGPLLGGQLVRTQTFTSSNYGLPVNFGGNACDVFVTATAPANPATQNLVEAITSLPNAPPPGGGPWLNGGVVCVA